MMVCYGMVGKSEHLLQLIHSTLSGVGLSSNAWGVSIIGMTVVIKALTFPLTRSQLESTNKMQVRGTRLRSMRVSLDLDLSLHGMTIRRRGGGGREG
jgi:membrane protein insertase Oxa1/YidC/SpoIIIJ